MKIRFSLIASFIFVATAMSISCSNTGTTNNLTNSNGARLVDRQTYKSVGVVKSIDIDADRVTVDHEEIPGYMSPMEMNEMVSDHELLGSIQVGDKVEFEILRTGSTVVYTKFTKIGEVAVLNGSEIYKTNCAECHGATGEGAEKGIPLTAGHALDHSEADFLKTVSDGKGKKKDKEMPAFRDKLTPEQIKEVVSYVRNDIQKGLKRNESHKH